MDQLYLSSCQLQEADSSLSVTAHTTTQVCLLCLSKGLPNLAKLHVAPARSQLYPSGWRAVSSATHFSLCVYTRPLQPGMDARVL